MKIQLSLQLKFAVMFFVVMVTSAVISIFVLLFLCNPLIIENNQTKIISIVGSMKQLEMKQLEMNTKLDTSTIISICAGESAEVRTIDRKDGEYYKVKIVAI